jgi:hypothetical protein
MPYAFDGLRLRRFIAPGDPLPPGWTAEDGEDIPARATPEDPAALTVAELKAELDKAGVTYAANVRKQALVEAVRVLQIGT